ncbi:MAG: hypothetical protein A3B23_04010 [Candidatus Colwellbacteria bacterium RIFCSPLOWO2_01_FULL_48_10]|nr:MAG: hypothetical protein A3B23_04010 [Candidatus Colwellbacteria bacterium RIFCSPLOWO2_01_FULL_48_10]
MLLTVILLSTAILGATSLVGLLMVYELRYSGDVVSSAQAIFAADAGIECASYRTYKDTAKVCGSVSAPIVLSNGATYRVEFMTGSVARSVGQSRKTARAFEKILDQ